MDLVNKGKHKSMKAEKNKAKRSGDDGYIPWEYGTDYEKYEALEDKYL